MADMLLGLDCTQPQWILNPVKIFKNQDLSKIKVHAFSFNSRRLTEVSY